MDDSKVETTLVLLNAIIERGARAESFGYIKRVEPLLRELRILPVGESLYTRNGDWMQWWHPDPERQPIDSFWPRTDIGIGVMEDIKTEILIRDADSVFNSNRFATDVHGKICCLDGSEEPRQIRNKDEQVQRAYKRAVNGLTRT